LRLVGQARLRSALHLNYGPLRRSFSEASEAGKAFSGEL